MARSVAPPAAPSLPTRAAWLARGYRLGSSLLLALILVQAVVAGQALFGSWGIELHGWMGNGSFTLGLVVAAVAGAARSGRAALAVSAILVVALFGQTGLGYVGRESATAAALHIPLGVAIFGLATANLMLAYRRA